MSVALIDTSVFCNIVPVPGRDQDRATVQARLKELVAAGTTLLLPLATVLETGNHIAQMKTGQKRREAATRFCKLIGDALENAAPWGLTQLWQEEDLRDWLHEFPGHAMQGRGMGDLSIIKEWERQRSLHRARRVFVWSSDGHLSSYDHTPAPAKRGGR